MPWYPPDHTTVIPEVYQRCCFISVFAWAHIQNKSRMQRVKCDRFSQRSGSSCTIAGLLTIADKFDLLTVVCPEKYSIQFWAVSVISLRKSFSMFWGISTSSDSTNLSKSLSINFWSQILASTLLVLVSNLNQS